MFIEKHQKIAILIFIIVAIILFNRGGTETLLNQGVPAFIFLVMILFYRLFAWLMSFGFLPSLASDAHNYKTGPFAVVFWILFLISIYVGVFNH